MLFVNMILAHAFLLSDKILSLSRCLFLLASVRQPYKSPAVGRYGDLKFQTFTAALSSAGDLSIHTGVLCFCTGEMPAGARRDDKLIFTV